MGIRIHKAMGYGFTDFKGPGDERLASPDVLDAHWYEDALEEFCQWVLANKDATSEDLQQYEGVTRSMKYYEMDLVEPFEEKHCWDYDPQVHEPEGGLESVILWIPPADKARWHRYNDKLDWYQAQAEHGDDYTPIVVDLWDERGQRGISHYERAIVKPQFRDKFLSLSQNPNAEETKQIADRGLEAHVYNHAIGVEGGRPFADEALLEHFKNDWTCDIPDSLMLYFQKMPILSDIKYAYDLKPLYYEWWA